MKHALIVAAVDADDDLAEAVLLAAEDLALRDKARIHIVGAWPRLGPSAAQVSSGLGAIPIDLGPEAIAADQRARAQTLEKLTALAKKSLPAAAVTMVDGEPADAISRFAKEAKADIIVSGSHQRGFWRALFTGTASRDFAREAPCAVFLVTKPYAERLLAARR